MRGIALKIFLSFWSVFAVLIALFAALPDRGAGVRLTDHVRQNGLVAATLFERDGPAACAAFSTAVQQQTHLTAVLFDSERRPVCAGESTVAAGDDAVTVMVQGPSGATFTATGAPLPGFQEAPRRPPFPAASVAAAILTTGFVCFALAAYLTRPLRRIRDASNRLAAGDLQARAGAAGGGRRDEIGEVVRDFDAMAGRIEALVQSQTQLLSDISHELRSPLARLNVALELTRRKAPAEAAGHLDRIETEAERMNELIGRLLALARAESGPAARPSAAVDLGDLVTDVASDAAYEAQRQHKSVDLRIVIAPVVTGDAQLIASAIDNVVRNAVRYTPEGSAVEVAVDRVDGDAVVTVRDHGSGVPVAELERIFSPFHRVEAARSRDAGGVGLGLAIAQRAVAVHGGSITAENAVDGGGLRVRISLPIDTPTSAH